MGRRAAATRTAEQAGPWRRGGGADTAVTVVVVVLLAVAVLSLLMAVVLPVNQLTQPGGDVKVALAPQAAEQAMRAVQGLPAETYLEAKPEQAVLSLHVAELSWPLQLLTEAPAALRALCVGLGALALLRLLMSFRDGRPFDRQNPRLLVALAALLLVGGLGGHLLDGLVRLVVLDSLGAGPGALLATSLSVDLVAVVLAVLLLALADVFRRGRQLTDDVRGLV